MWGDLRTGNDGLLGCEDFGTPWLRIFREISGKKMMEVSAEEMW